MKKLKIAQISPLWVKVPPERSGGIERVVYDLTEGLVSKGHDVTLFASGDSKTSGKLVSVHPQSIKMTVRKEMKNGKDCGLLGKPYLDLLNITNAFIGQKQFDIYHSHIGSLSLFLSPFIEKPVLTTLHNPIRSKEHRLGEFLAIQQLGRYQKYVSISKFQQRITKPDLDYAANIYNGVDIDNFKLNERPDDYLFWIGRITKEKGLKEAVLAAKKAKKDLVIAGPKPISHSAEDKYFKGIKKHLDNKDSKIRYLGELNHQDKIKYFSNARALLFPVQWEEPFGLVMIEAMACGTPVIGFDRGSVSEIIKNGKTGFVVPPFNNKGEANIGGLVEAIKKIGTIDRKECRRHVEDNFSTKKMIDSYEEIYYKILENRK